MKNIIAYDSPVGKITLAGDGTSITGLWIEGQKYFGRTLETEEIEERGMEVFRAACRWLDHYFRGEKEEIPFSLAPKGSDFQQSVWNILREVPYGKTITYGMIAKKLAEQLGRESMSAQAVGGAIARNPISILIPCHRVVGTNGSLTGYAGGIERKIQLLELEKADMSRFFVPKPAG